MPNDAGAIMWAPRVADHMVRAPTSAPLTFDQANTTVPTTVTQKLLPSAAMGWTAPPAIGIAYSWSAASSE